MQGTQTTGLICAALAAACFGSIPPLAGVAYANGVNPITVIAFRAGMGLAGGLLLTVLLKRSFTVPKAAWPAVLGTTLGLFLISFCYMYAISLIPVSLAVLVLYTFPFMILISDSVINRRRPGLPLIMAIVVAFSGLSLALGTTLAELDWRGVALMLVAAIGAVLSMMFGARAGRHIGIIRLTVWTHMIAVPAFLVAVPQFGGFALPQADPGWWSLAAIGVFYIAAVLALFAAVSIADPVPAAIILHLEPLVTIAAAMFLLSESLTGTQYLGAALIIVAVLSVTRQTSAVKP